MKNSITKAILILAILLCWSGSAISAEGVFQRAYENSIDGTMTVLVTWEATALGGVTPFHVSGLTPYYVWKMLTDPSGVTGPTDNYDVYLIDIEHGNDILGGQGLNRDATNSEVAIPCIDISAGLYGGYYLFDGSGVSLHIRNNDVSGASGTVTFFGYK